MFRNLKILGTYVKTDYKNGNIYTCATTDGNNGGILITNYSEHDSDFAEDVVINLKYIMPEEGVSRIKIYITDENHDGEIVYDEPYDWLGRT